MNKRRCIASVVMLILFAICLTGYLPWIESEEQRLAYMIKTMEAYSVLEVVYDVNYDSMLLHGTYQWNQKKNEHRMNGSITSENLTSELIGFKGMIAGDDIYFQMDRVIPQVFKMNLSQKGSFPILSEIDTIFQTNSIYDVLSEVEFTEKPRFKIISINGRYIGIYIIEGTIEKRINAKNIEINYSIYTDGWGHLKKIDVEIQSDRQITFCGHIQPIKKFSILSMNVEEAIAF